MTESFSNALVGVLPRLRRFAYGLTGSPDEGDDVVQAACARALERNRQWQPGTRLDSWMYRIVQTIWIDRTRRRRRWAAAPVGAVEHLVGGDGPRETEARLTLAAVRRLVALLPEEQRVVLLLVTVEGVSYREAAEVLDVPIGTVMSRLARARVTLGRWLEGEEGAGASE